MDRLQQLKSWVEKQFPGKACAISPASADASFRRYFRIDLGDKTAIAMDAPPPHEDCRPFVSVANLFGAAGVNVPQVLAQNLEQGFLLLSDLGNTTYLQALNEDNAQQLYLDAIDALIKIQLASKPGVLPDYNETLLKREILLFPDWYLARQLNVTLTSQQQAALEMVFQAVLHNNLAQPHVFVHRDYHTRNLMVTEPNPGVLDFQDAVYGPITYDLVSLFKDAYIAWDEERVLDWVIRYWEKAKKARLPVDQDFAAFYRDFEWMGVQRHLKVLGIFARLYHRDSKDGYLKDMPLVMRYLRKACERYHALTPLLGLLDAIEDKPPPEIGHTF